jgi:hypothetical protein
LTTVGAKAEAAEASQSGTAVSPPISAKATIADVQGFTGFKNPGFDTRSVVRRLLELRQSSVEAEAAWFCARRIILEGLHELTDNCLRRHHYSQIVGALARIVC